MFVIVDSSCRHLILFWWSSTRIIGKESTCVSLWALIILELHVVRSQFPLSGFVFCAAWSYVTSQKDGIFYTLSCSVGSIPLRSQFNWTWHQKSSRFNISIAFDTCPLFLLGFNQSTITLFRQCGNHTFWSVGNLEMMAFYLFMLDSHVIWAETHGCFRLSTYTALTRSRLWTVAMLVEFST